MTLLDLSRPSKPLPTYPECPILCLMLERWQMNCLLPRFQEAAPPGEHLPLVKFPQDACGTQDTICTLLCFTRHIDEHLPNTKAITNHL